MQGLTASQLLEVWERGEARHPLDRALMILSTGDSANPMPDWDSLANLQIGERNRRLLELRAATFGTTIAMATSCPACNEPLEFTIDSKMLTDAAPPLATQSLHLQAGGFDLALRLPTSHDLAMLYKIAGDVDNGMTADPAGLRNILARRCVIDAPHAAGTAASEVPDVLPEDVVAALSDILAQADPLADIRFALSCPKCAQESQQPLDVAAFFWGEIVAQARRLLAEVDTLARAYHWREADILALEPRRRQAYLERVLS